MSIETLISQITHQLLNDKFGVEILSRRKAATDPRNINVFFEFLYLSILFSLVFCLLPYIALVFLFFINSIVFPTGLMDAYRTGAFLYIIAGFGGFLGVFVKHAKRLVELPDSQLELFEPFLRRLSINYLLGMIVGCISLSVLKSKTLLALAYSNNFDGVPDPTEHAVFFVAFLTGMFSIELLQRANNELTGRLGKNSKKSDEVFQPEADADKSTKDTK